MDATLATSHASNAADTALEWPEPAPVATVLCTAEVAECTCPDFCERDHGNE